MKNILSKIFITLFVVMSALTPLALQVSDAGAVNLYPACGGKTSQVCKSTNDDAGTLIKSVVNILLYVLATISVIMIIVGGIRYATANGDSSGLTAAKNTILYAVIGLVVAMLSWSIVNFVIGMF